MTGPVALRIPVLAGAVEVTGLDDAQARELERVWRRCGPVRLEASSAAPAAAPDAAAPDAEEPGAEEPGAAEPGAGEPGAGEPGAAAPATAQPTPEAPAATRPAAGAALHPVLAVDRAALTVFDDRAFGEHLVTTATRAAIESRVGERLLIHGAALADPGTGATIALVGESGAGKTTATRALGRRLAYLTDETVSIGDDLGVERFEKPLSKLVDGRRPKVQLGPDELELLPGVDGARLAVVAVLARDAEADGPEVRPLPLRDALVAIVPQTSSLARLPRGLVRLCEALDACGGAIALRYAEAATLAPLVAGLLVAPREPTAREWRPIDAEALGVDEADPIGADARLRRRPLSDAVEVGGEVVVLGEQGLAVLSGLAPVVLDASAGWRAEAEIVAAVRRELGDHPDAARLVAESIEALLAHGLLERRAPDGAE